MDAKDRPGLFRLVRDEDESGVSGTGHVADGVIWHDGTCTVHWRTEHTSTTVYRDFATVLAIHGHGGKTRADLVEHPYDRGGAEAAKVEAIVTMDEAMLDEMLRAEGRDPATVVGQQRELLRAAAARARGGE